MKGLGIFIGIILVTAIGCVAIPFLLMPNSGIGAALPVIYVPGEALATFGSVAGVNITNTMVGAWLTMIVVFVWVIPIVSRRKEVPGRGQALVEILVDAWVGLAESSAGKKGRQLVPLALSIFFFLLVANLMKVVPTVDTVGELHCAGIHQGEGEGATFIQLNGYPVHDTTLGGIHVLNVTRAEGKAVNTGTKISEADYEACHHDLEAGIIPVVDPEILSESDPGDEAAVMPVAEASSGDHAAEGEATTEAATTEGEHSTEGAATTETAAAEGEHAAEGEEHGVNRGVYVVTPFVRGASTDLAMTFAIAIVAMIAVQYFGIKELGLAGWGSKFINLPALERGGMGFMDFAVGLLETFLEFAKVVSFAFRLFGAMFGGQVLMFVIVFLVATVVPVIVIGLEVFIGAIQAFVFAILFLMFSAVAMTSHSHDEHEEAHH